MLKLKFIVDKVTCTYSNYSLLQLYWFSISPVFSATLSPPRVSISITIYRPSRAF